MGQVHAIVNLDLDEARASVSIRVHAVGEDDESVHPIAARNLNAICAYCLTSEGAALLENMQTKSTSDVQQLIERAAAHVSFQPRFLNVNLIGVSEGADSAFPPMDDIRDLNSVDPYIMFQLVPPTGGEPYPLNGVRSRTIYQNAHPTWHEELELTLQGGAVQSDGYFRGGAAAENTLLLVQAFDADVGVWGKILGVLSTTAIALLAAAVLGYITGLTDNLADDQLRIVAWVAMLIVFFLIGAVLKSLVMRSDDDLIGAATLPLQVLMDQETHLFQVELFPPPVVFYEAGPIGLKLEEAEGRVYVYEVEPGSQACTKGVQVGAAVVTLNGISTVGKSQAQVAKAIHGPERPLSLVLNRPCDAGRELGTDTTRLRQRGHKSKCSSGGVGKIKVALEFSER